MESLPAFIRHALAEPRPDALVERVEGTWRSLSSAELQERIDDVAAALREIAGLRAGERVAIMAHNCVDWLVADIAALSAGLIVVPIFATQAIDQVAYILEHSETKFVFADVPSAQRLRERLGSAAPPICVFGGGHEGSLHRFEAEGRTERALRAIDVSGYTSGMDPSTMAVLIYTSGTTGAPKGVMLSHGNLISNTLNACRYAFSELAGGGKPVLSVLPFSHIYEHSVAYGHLYHRCAYYICRSPNELADDLRDVRPLAVTVVPRIFERVLAAIVSRARSQGGARAVLVPWALAAGREYLRAKLFGAGPSFALRARYAVARRLVLSKLRPLLGLDRLAYFISGSAKLHLDLALTFAAAGITILEGYGPTECSPVISVNRLSDNRYGTVGKPLPSVDLKIAYDGEIVVRGPNVMLGYYRDPLATAEVLIDGWYHTGDVGELDDDGYLRITDRKKEIFKTSTGKFVAPSRVEAALIRSMYISQAVVVGADMPYPVALVAPDFESVRKQLSLDPAMSDAELSRRREIRAFLAHEAARNTADLARFEQIRHVGVLPRELTIEDGELTPTLKIRRRVVERRYEDLIRHLYPHGEAAPV